MRKGTRVLLVTMGALALGLFVNVAQADKAKKKGPADYQKMFEDWSGSVAEFQKRDTNGAAVREIETIRTLIGQGQAFLASEKLKEIRPIEEPATVLIRYTKVKIQRVEAENAAAEAERQARLASEEAERAKSEADQLEAKYAVLEKEGL